MAYPLVLPRDLSRLQVYDLENPVYGVQCPGQRENFCAERALAVFRKGCALCNNLLFESVRAVVEYLIIHPIAAQLLLRTPPSELTRKLHPEPRAASTRALSMYSHEDFWSIAKLHRKSAPLLC